LGAQLSLSNQPQGRVDASRRSASGARRAIQQQIKLAEDEVRSIGAGLVGTLDIGATGSILRGRLADLLAAYREGCAFGEG
jgi:DNA-binding transcriptional LysR family regulator